MTVLSLRRVRRTFSPLTVILSLTAIQLAPTPAQAQDRLELALLASFISLSLPPPVAAEASSECDPLACPLLLQLNSGISVVPFGPSGLVFESDSTVTGKVQANICVPEETVEFVTPTCSPDGATGTLTLTAGNESVSVPYRLQGPLGQLDFRLQLISDGAVSDLTLQLQYRNAEQAPLSLSVLQGGVWTQLCAFVVPAFGWSGQVNGESFLSPLAVQGVQSSFTSPFTLASFDPSTWQAVWAGASTVPSVPSVIEGLFLGGARYTIQNGVATREDPAFVRVAIKPGGSPNINPNKRGVVPVAAYGSSGFNAQDIDPLTVSLDGAVVRVNKKGITAVDDQDLDADGFTDRTVHIDAETLGLPVGKFLAFEATTFDRGVVKGIAAVNWTPDP